MRMLLISYLFLLYFSIDAQHLLKFEKLSPLPIGTLAFGYSQSKERIYIIGGATNQDDFNSNLHIYNKKIDQWVNLPLTDFPQAKYSAALYLEEYNSLFVAGGIEEKVNNIVIVERVNLISLDRYQTSSLGRLPYVAKNMKVSRWKNKLLFYGGAKSINVDEMGNRSFTFTDQVFSYDLKSGTVDHLPNLPVPMETSGGIIDGHLYTFGGFAGSSKTDIWRYDIEAQKWSPLEPFDQSVSANAVARYKNFFVLVGDYRNTDQLILYDTEMQKAYYFKMNLKGHHMGASVLGDDLHIYGGLSGGVASVRHFKIAMNQIIKQIEER